MKEESATRPTQPEDSPALAAWLRGYYSKHPARTKPLTRERPVDPQFERGTYGGYVGWCKSLGLIPASFESWLEIQNRI